MPLTLSIRTIGHDEASKRGLARCQRPSVQTERGWKIRKLGVGEVIAIEAQGRNGNGRYEDRPFHISQKQMNVF